MSYLEGIENADEIFGEEIVTLVKAVPRLYGVVNWLENIYRKMDNLFKIKSKGLNDDISQFYLQDYVHIEKRHTVDDEYSFKLAKALNTNIQIICAIHELENKKRQNSSESSFYKTSKNKKEKKQCTRSFDFENEDSEDEVSKDKVSKDEISEIYVDVKLYKKALDEIEVLEKKVEKLRGKIQKSKKRKALRKAARRSKKPLDQKIHLNHDDGDNIEIDEKISEPTFQEFKNSKKNESDVLSSYNGFLPLEMFKNHKMI